MSISFRISNFSFNLFNFAKKNAGESKDAGINSNLTKLSSAVDDKQTTMIFDKLKLENSLEKKQTKTSLHSDAISDTMPSNPIKFSANETKLPEVKNHEEKKLEVVKKPAKELSMTFKSQYRDVRQKKQTNIYFKMANKDLLISKAHKNRSLDNLYKLTIENDESGVSDKKNQEMKELLKQELLRQKFKTIR